MEALKSSITELDYVSDFSYSLDGQPNSSYSKFSIIVVFENEEMMRLHDEDVLIEIFHFFSVNQQIMKDLDDIDALVYGIDYKYESSDDTLYYSSHERDAGSIDIWSVNNSHYIRIVEDGYYIFSSDLLEDGEFVAWDK